MAEAEEGSEPPRSGNQQQQQHGTPYLEPGS